MYDVGSPRHQGDLAERVHSEAGTFRNDIYSHRRHIKEGPELILNHVPAAFLGNAFASRNAVEYSIPGCKLGPSNAVGNAECALKDGHVLSRKATRKALTRTRVDDSSP